MRGSVLTGTVMDLPRKVSTSHFQSGGASLVCVGSLPSPSPDTQQALKHFFTEMFGELTSGLTRFNLLHTFLELFVYRDTDMEANFS